MISFEDITKLFKVDLKGERCIEIEFSINDSSKYLSCWMGKMPNKDNIEKEVYWYGLHFNGSEQYGYDNFCDFFLADVFDGKTLKEIWEKVDILSIDGCDPNERFLDYF